MALFKCPRDGQTFEDNPIDGRCPVHGILLKPIPDMFQVHEGHEADDTDDTDEDAPDERTPGPAARF